MVSHTYINDKLEIQSDKDYVILSMNPGRFNLLYFEPVGDALNHGVFMTNDKALGERLHNMANNSGAFFKMIKDDLSKTIIEKEIPITPIETTVKKLKTAVNYANLKWMELRNYAGQMNMPDYAKSKKSEILEWLGENIG